MGPQPHKPDRINKFHRWLLKYLIKKIITQGGHGDRIGELYRIIYLLFREEFTEDSESVAHGFLHHCFIEGHKDE